MSFWLPILIFFPLICLQGFFTGSEIAIVSCDRLKMMGRANRGSSGAKLVLYFLEHPEQFLSVTLVCINYVSILNTSLMTWFFLENIHMGIKNEIVMLATVWPTMLIFAEIFPKILFQHFSDRIAPVVSPILYAISVTLFPLLLVIRKSTGFIDKTFFRRRSSIILGATRDELKRIFKKYATESGLNKEESSRLSSMLEFSEKQVREVMVPLIQVYGIEAKSTVLEALQCFSEFEHSRLPVYDERVDRVIGIAHSFDLLGLGPEDLALPIQNFMKECLFIAPSLQIDRLFEQMRRKGHSLVVVVNEFGGSEGVVTIEDLVEQVIGDIDDEFDDQTVLIHRISSDSYVVKGSTPIEELNALLPEPIPLGDYETIAGFLLEKFQRIPLRLDFINVKGVQFTIMKATERSIDEVHVRVVHHFQTEVQN